ncbi:kinase-like domain-containing protein [Obelidium mucronatum]|nr:kinase-like domain-containing protein [Obelidium mucronatum]
MLGTPAQKLTVASPALAGKTIAMLKLPPPFDSVTSLVGAILTLCGDMQQNRADTRRLADTVSTLGCTLDRLTSTEQHVKAHAARLLATLGEIHTFLGSKNEEAKKTLFKRLFAKMTEAAFTSVVKAQIAEYDKDLNEGIAKLNLSLTVDQRNVGFNEAQQRQLASLASPQVVAIDDIFKYVVAKMKQAGLDSKDKSQLVALSEFLIGQDNLRNIDASLKSYLPIVKNWYATERPNFDPWKSVSDSAEYLEYNRMSVPVQVGLYYFTYKGKYLGQTVSVKDFHDIDPHVPLGAIEKAIKNDLKFWKELSHLPYVHTLIGSSTREESATRTRSLKLIAEFCPMQIDEYVMKHPEQLFRVLYELLSGLEDIHNAGVVHRDLCPRNVLITQEGTVAISDFGMCRRNAQQVSTSLHNPKLPSPSINFQSPESGERRPSNATDIWSFGMIAFFLITKIEPYVGLSNDETRLAIEQGQLPNCPDLKARSREFSERGYGGNFLPIWGLICGCWAHNPQRRFTAQYIKKGLEISFEREINVKPAKA